MDWAIICLAAVVLYAAVAWTIRSRELFPRHVAWYGPCSP